MLVNAHLIASIICLICGVYIVLDTKDWLRKLMEMPCKSVEKKTRITKAETNTKAFMIYGYLLLFLAIVLFALFLNYKY